MQASIIHLFCSAWLLWFKVKTGTTKSAPDRSQSQRSSENCTFQSVLWGYFHTKGISVQVWLFAEMHWLAHNVWDWHCDNKKNNMSESGNWGPSTSSSLPVFHSVAPELTVRPIWKPQVNTTRSVSEHIHFSVAEQPVWIITEWERSQGQSKMKQGGHTGSGEVKRLHCVDVSCQHRPSPDHTAPVFYLSGFHCLCM